MRWLRGHTRPEKTKWTIQLFTERFRGPPINCKNFDSCRTLKEDWIGRRKWWLDRKERIVTRYIYFPLFPFPLIFVHFLRVLLFVGFSIFNNETTNGRMTRNLLHSYPSWNKVSKRKKVRHDIRGWIGGEERERCRKTLQKENQWMGMMNQRRAKRNGWSSES